MIVGGKSKSHDLAPRPRAAHGCRGRPRAVKAIGGSLLVSFTRRTPARGPGGADPGAWPGVPGWIWDGEGDNPYFAFLGAAMTSSW